MAVTMLRNPAVLKRRGRGRSAHHDDIRAGLFVKPVLIGARSVATPDYEVDALIAARIAGATDDQVRALVRQLMAARTSITGLDLKATPSNSAPSDAIAAEDGEAPHKRNTGTRRHDRAARIEKFHPAPQNAEKAG